MAAIERLNFKIRIFFFNLARFVDEAKGDKNSRMSEIESASPARLIRRSPSAVRRPPQGEMCGALQANSKACHSLRASAATAAAADAATLCYARARSRSRA